MALSKTVKQTKPGFSGELLAENAYIKVESISGDKSSVSALVTFKAGDVFIDRKTYTFEPAVSDAAKNFIAQAYEYLKTLPEFAGAKDC